MRVNRQRRPDHDQRRAVFRHRDRLLDRKAAYGLHGKADCFDDGFQIVERAEALTRVGEDAVSLVEAGVMHDVIDAQVFHPFRGCGFVSQTILSPITLTPKSRPALTTHLIVSACARAITTTCVAPALAIISASR